MQHTFHCMKGRSEQGPPFLVFTNLDTPVIIYTINQIDLKMKIQIKRKTGSTVLPSTGSAGEPILSTRAVGSSNLDSVYIRSLDGTSWKGIAMTAYTPGYENADSTTVSPFSQYILWFGTQAQYDAITTKDANTFYFITE